MTDVASAVATALGKLIDSGKIEGAIEAEIEKTVRSAFHNQLREWSDFGKAIEEHIKGAIQVNLKQLTLPAYNEIILDVLRKKLDETMYVYGREQIAKNMDKLLGGIAGPIKLSKLVEDFKESLAFWHDEHDDEIAFFADLPNPDISNSRWVYMDGKASTSKYSCAVSFLVTDADPDHRRKASEPLERGHISHIKLDKSRAQSSNTLFIGDFYSFERDLFQLHAGKVELIMDLDHVDRSMPQSDECHCD